MATKPISVRIIAEGGQQVRAELIQIGDAGEQMGVRLSRGSAIGKAGLQNIGFQIQDFAVQVGAGASATQALAQQLPQLLSGFGPLGVAVGTLAAVGIPLLTYALSDAGEKASEAKKEIDALVRATQDFQTTAQSIRLGVDEVEVETVVALNKALKERAALEEQIRAQGPGNYSADLKAEYSIVNETVRALTEKVDAYRNARDQAETLTAENERARLSVEQMNAALTGAYGLYSNLRGQAAALADENFRAAAAAASLNYGKIQNAGDSGPDAAKRSVQGLNAVNITGTLASGAGGVKVASRSGSGGGGAGQNDTLREAARIYDQTRTEAEKYSAEVEKLDTLLRSGAISQDTYNRALDDLKDKTAGLSEGMRELQDSVGEAFVSLVTGAKSAKEAVADLLASLAETLANQAFQQLAGGLFGGGGGLFGGLFAKRDLFANIGGGRAGGGPVEAGRVYIAGERGPEPIFMTGNGYVLPNEALRGGGAGITIVNNIDARGAVEGTADLIDRKLRAAMPEMQRQAVAATIKAQGRGFG